MSREIRMVPPNYEHPKKYNNKYESLHYDFEKDLKEFEDYVKENGFRRALGYYGGAPSPEDYMCIEYNKDDNCYYGIPLERRTWFQVFETVSEGSPDTPPFATKEELIEYLCTEGSLYHKEYPDVCPILTREQAEAFVGKQWAPSMAICDGDIKVGAQALVD